MDVDNTSVVVNNVQFRSNSIQWVGQKVDQITRSCQEVDYKWICGDMGLGLDYEVKQIKQIMEGDGFMSTKIEQLFNADQTNQLSCFSEYFNKYSEQTINYYPNAVYRTNEQKDVYFSELYSDCIYYSTRVMLWNEHNLKNVNYFPIQHVVSRHKYV